jgi:glycosyltransferase involved in cell wall biosynthesis
MPPSCPTSDTTDAHTISSNRPAKVLHILNSAGGGAALSTLALISEFQKLGIESCAICDDAGSAGERQRLSDVVRGAVRFTPLYWWNRKIRAKLWKRPLLELRQLLRTGWLRRSTRQVVEFAIEQQVDLIHSNTILTPEGGLAARQLGLPHVWHLREMLGRGNPFPLRMTGSRLRRFITQHASLVVANSHVAAASAGDSIPPSMMRVVPNGIDLHRFTPRGNLPGRDGAVVVAMVGAITSRTKRHALFVEAAGQLADRSDLEFRIYGHDPIADSTHRDAYGLHIHALAESYFGGNGRFRFAGQVSDPVQIMSEIDILVHPAENESFGRVAVEAMAAGLPVVGVRGGGIGEIVVDGETGLLATPKDPVDLAEKMRQLIDSPELCSKFGAFGRKRAELHYSIEACASGVLKAYEDAMQNPVGAAHGVARP